MKLSDDDIEAIAEKIADRLMESDEYTEAVAEKTVQQLVEHFQTESGKFFLSWLAKLLFAAAIALAAVGITTSGNPD